ncbi:lipid IV(A) palmitoyltransferase PagP [Propionivibrio sp.]|uniref:lipid IV(A) palmitoyltransferase PagP n=1 Tax=Propionivibrio sp. TaxID=2212460 RepID=UPI002635E05C|nr:lipid IV(A) palmitoyltransferase PagP [Propionivibrio sp.]
MNFPSRRKPLALFFYYGFVSVLVGGYAGQVQAQAPVPLRVDPALLGLPPIKPAEAPTPAASPGPVDRPRSEVMPVEAPVVEARPVEAQPQASKASAQEISARSPAPQAVPSVPVTSPAKPPDSVPQAPRPTVQPSAQAAATASSATNFSTLAPLRVDPALLRQPTVSATTPVAQEAPGAVVAGRPATVASAAHAASGAKSAGADKSWFRRIWDPVADAYDNGAWEFYLPVHTHHLRSAYSAEKIATYQESPLGFGVGKGLYDEKGNWQGVYAMAFQDSHFKPMYIAGYGWKAIWRPAEDVRLGLGYTAGLMSRTDIAHYIPFPAVLPLASLAYKNLNLETTFVPGGNGTGNIFFIWAKWELGKTGEAVGTPARPPAPSEIANTAFGQATTPAHQRVPYGPALEVGAGSRLASSAQTVPPQVPATGSRDEEEVPDALPPLALRSAKTMVPPAKDSAVPRPVFLSALRMGGDVDREFNAEGDAELRKIGTVVNSDRLTYWPIDDEIEAEGNVRLEQGADRITGPKMRLKLEDQIGFFEQPSYTIKRQPQAGSKAAADKAFATNFTEQLRNDDSWLTSGFASPRAFDIRPGQTTLDDSTRMPKGMTEGRGDADRIDFEGENQVRLTNGSYTTCAPGNNDWYLKASELKLDYDREVADGRDGAVYFKGVPIIYSPWLSFSLNNERKSGFLAPTFGTSSTSGIDLALPYYWNIAPNMDATIAPRVFTKRGVQIGSEVRYLNTAFGGLYGSQARFELLPDDKLRNGDNRYAYSLMHTQATANGFSGLINYSKVSDDNYYTDLSSRIASTSQVNLLQQGMLSYGGGGWWTATANFQSYQTLQPDQATVNPNPYRMLPQITFTARKPDLYTTDSSFLGQYTAFTKPKQVINGVVTTDPDGQRTVLYPQVALPYVTPGWYVTPKIGVNATHYALSGQAAGIPDAISRTLPIFSVDSGMTFERSSNWFGRDYTQTLEPRLFYLNVPYKNQDQIPIFDTGLADFNFAQIFSENQFSGWDRVSNANQLTAAAMTRLLEPSTGNEIMRAMLGQRFYFTQNRVKLPGAAPDSGKWDKSDFLAAFSGQLLPRVYADTAVQYNLSDQQVKRYSIGTRYQPEPGKVLNLAYRYNRDSNAPIDQIDLSGQWPITGGWHAVGRINYSFKDDASNTSTSSQGGRLIESIGGLEYNGGCWVVRGVIQRIALTQASNSTGFFIQLELSDFSRIGSNPLNLLKRNIQGYSLINQPTADPVFGQ